MINFDKFERLEATRSRLEKVSILKEFNDEEKGLLVAALNPDVVYNIKKLPKFGGTTCISDHGDGVFEALLSYLSHKDALNNNDRQMVEDFLKNCNVDQQKWYSRVLLKDLRCGIDASTVNVAIPGLIPCFGVALANRFDPVRHGRAMSLYIVDVKLDGCRMTVRMENGTAVWAKSRTGKPITTANIILQAMEGMADGVYDGELYVHSKHGFQELMQYLRRDAPIPSSLPVRFVMFDWVSLEEWDEDDDTKVDMSYDDRLTQLLDNMIDQNHYTLSEDGLLMLFGDRLGMTQELTVLSVDGLMSELNRVIEAGYEGLMCKMRTAEYVKSRSNNILKVKQMYTVDRVEEEAVVTEVIEGTGRLVGMMGALRVIGPNGEPFKIGSGFDDATREEVWANRITTVGRIVEYFRQEQLTADGKPKFPIFHRFRVDKEAGH